MASTCPKCHQVIETDSVCCADVKYTWKCKSCAKLSTGFVVPYGRCFLCGGENELIKGYTGVKPDLVAIVQEAMQYEIDMYHFYRLALNRTKDKVLRAVLEELYHKEEDHIDELEEKYHLHLDPSLRKLPESREQIASDWIFKGIDFDHAEGHILQVYDKAISMERRTRDRFLEYANTLPPGAQKEIYRELAAEEEDHVSILETEREQFLSK
jgi:glutamate synthase (NADPH/NADH) small chain